MRAGNASAAVITDDKLQGIWIKGSTNVRIMSPNVSTLRCQWSGQAATPRFTRGISIGGASNDVEIHDPYVYSADQLIDISGDEFPTKVKVIGGTLLEGATGLKCANSPTYVRVVGVTADKCGASAFIVSAPGSVLATMTSKIDFIGCTALGTGYDTGGAVATKIAFRCTNSPVALNTPSETRFIDCVADHDGLGLMQYGFSNDAGSVVPNRNNKIVNCRVNGASTAAVSGFSISQNAYVSGRFYGGGFINPANTATLVLNANTHYAIPFEVKWHTEWSEINFTVSVGAAGSARVGLYTWDNGVPSALITEGAAPVSVSALGSKTAGISQYLEPGIYALTILSDTTPTVYCSTATIPLMEVVGVTSPGTTAAVQISRAQAYGPLPAVFGAVTYSALNVPNLMMRPA